MLYFANNVACVFSFYEDFFDVNPAAKNYRSDLADKSALLAQIWRLKQLSNTWFHSLMDKYISFLKITQDVFNYSLFLLYAYISDLRKKLINIYFQFIKIIAFV